MVKKFQKQKQLLIPVGSCYLNVNYPQVQVGYGFENNESMWSDELALIDTGCDTTCFDTKIYNQIISINPQYANYTRIINIQAVGSVNLVYQNKMDIKIGNEILKNHIVNFASINNIILIGRDIINNGLFIYESNKWISYTKHI